MQSKGSTFEQQSTGLVIYPSHHNPSPITRHDVESTPPRRSYTRFQCYQSTVFDTASAWKVLSWLEIILEGGENDIFSPALTLIPSWGNIKTPRGSEEKTREYHRGHITYYVRREIPTSLRNHTINGASEAAGRLDVFSIEPNFSSKPKPHNSRQLKRSFPPRAKPPTMGTIALTCETCGAIEQKSIKVQKFRAEVHVRPQYIRICAISIVHQRGSHLPAV